jgi:hypothetical protein
MELLLADGQTLKQFDENEPDVLDGGKFYPFARGVPHLLWFVLRIEGGIPIAVVEDSHTIFYKGIAMPKLSPQKRDFPLKYCSCQ